MRALVWLTLTVAACGSNSSAPTHDDPWPGDPSAGDPSAGDPLAGDPLAGDPLAGDPLAGDAQPECALAGVAGACIGAADCVGASYLDICDGPPSVQCCLAGESPCSVSGAPGVCIDTAACPAGWQPTAGLCPGATNIQCCTETGVACDDTVLPLPNDGLAEASWDGSCPDGMVTVTSFCIDKFEASLVLLDSGGAVVSTWSPYHNPAIERVRAVSIAGAVPQGYINGNQAAAACAEAGKRLCTDAEWLRACQGTSSQTYPYGTDREPGWCNDARSRHPAIEFFGTSDAWVWSELGNSCISQIPDSVHSTGQHALCESDEGAFDMMGNLHEWTSDPNGTFRGGFYADTSVNGDGCEYVTTAHGRSHWDYSTGFRCCADR